MYANGVWWELGDGMTDLTNKLDTISGHLNEMKVDVAEIRKDLNYHIRRTDILEERVEPIVNHVALVNNGIKIAVALAAIAVFLKEMGLI